MRPRAILILFVLFNTLVPAHAAIIVTDRALQASSSASFVYSGVTYSASQVDVGTVSVSSQALAGTSSTPELRTAARASVEDITANARLDDKFRFSNVNFQDNDSIATFSVVIFKIGGGAERISASIYFPPSYVEVSSFVEIPYATLTPAIFAEINVVGCSTPSLCVGPSTGIFDFQSYIDGSYNSFQYLVHAESQPGVDLSPLLNPVITDQIGGGSRLSRVEFPGYGATLDLGTLGAGEALKFEYRIEARVTGIGAGNVGIAAINDPFFFSGTPTGPGVDPGITASPAAASVPEPATGLLLIAGVGLVWVRRRLTR
jgi:hypothetical protein